MFDRLLVAIDGSDNAGPALSFTAGLASRYGATVYVLHVNQYLVGGRGHTVITEKEAAELVDSAVGQLRELGIDAVGFVRRATAFNLPRVIVDTARATEADALIVGSSRRRGLRRRFGHGIRERVTGLSPFPVLTAPAPLNLPAELSARISAARLPARL